MKSMPITSILRNDTVKPNAKNTTDGLRLLKSINNGVITAVCFDPQYQGMFKKLKYKDGSKRLLKARFACLK